ncbi:NUDIX hydrolase [Longispora albida]|uniref:NUDIX hydrolase n=1 Tax=Longispora albida TaxID=203523 RepID=UPI00035F284E|nr:NUDIX hydrolase [Longispora albida]
MIIHRPAVRVLCLDENGRILLIQWRDPFDGHLVWEPPGGGVEDGESYLDTARRELAEETGLDPARIGERYVMVERDVRWNGKHYGGAEAFFLARYAGTPEVRPAGLMPDETGNLVSHAWVTEADLKDLTGDVEPPQLLAVLASLAEG